MSIRKYGLKEVNIMKKFRLIYNQAAGQNRFKASLDDIIGLCSEADIELTVFRATKQKGVEEYIKTTPASTDGIIIAGGDGTLNKAVNAMKKHNIDVPLGIIPAGTSNDFATHLKLPTDFLKATKKIIDGHVEEVDIGKVNDTYFVNVLSAGVFASTSYKTDKKLKDVFGQASYFLTAVSEGLNYKPFTVEIKTEDAVITEKIAVFVVFNGSSVGRINKFSYQSSIKDGKLDLVLLRDTKAGGILKIIGEIEDGTFIEDENIVYLKEKNMVIKKISGKCDNPDVDGDEGPDFPLSIECIEKGLKLIV